ncbi:hypothetical protein [Anabaena sp. UHCC 0399]|nr:hypothetical protein [Anabaena sp. UHCC 0399]MEA5567211.1 hypothetical protein [Anabaena sp. UHCC 0399]
MTSNSRPATATLIWHFGTYGIFEVGMVIFANVFMRQYRLAESLG